jgi:hypothetical protein
MPKPSIRRYDVEHQANTCAPTDDEWPLPLINR